MSGPPIDNVDGRLFNATDEIVSHKVEEMDAASFPNGFCTGIFMGVKCDLTHWVPVKRKETSPPDASGYHDFCIEDWVPCHKYGQTMDRVENTRILGDIRPADEDNSVRFVVLWDAQTCPYLLLSTYVRGPLCFGRGPEWYGGILVLKTDVDRNVMDMTDEDKEITKRMAMNSVYASIRGVENYQPRPPAAVSSDT